MRVNLGVRIVAAAALALAGIGCSRVSQTNYVREAESLAGRGPTVSKLRNPTEGMHYIWNNLTWHTETIKEGTYRGKTYWFARAPTIDENKNQYTIYLVAGYMGDAANGCPIQPPTRPGESVKQGLCIEHTKGKEGIDEIVKLTWGFLWVQVERGNRGNGMINPWPLIIRTKGKAAGAYSTDFVLSQLTVPAAAESIREYVFRPNQDDTKPCDDAAESDGKKHIHVYAQIVGSNLPTKLDDTTSHVYEPMIPSLSVHSPKNFPEEVGFLKSTCAFARQAIREIKNMAQFPTAKEPPCEEVRSGGSGS